MYKATTQNKKKHKNQRNRTTNKQTITRQLFSPSLNIRAANYTIEGQKPGGRSSSSLVSIIGMETRVRPSNVE